MLHQGSIEYSGELNKNDLDEWIKKQTYEAPTIPQREPPKVRTIHHHAAIVKVKRVKVGSELIIVIHNIKGRNFYNTGLNAVIPTGASASPVHLRVTGPAVSRLD